MADCDALWARILASSGEPCLALRFGEVAADSLGGHVLFAVMQNSPTLGAALDGLRRYHGLLVDGAAPSARVEGGSMVVSIDSASGIGARYAEAVLVGLVRVVARLSCGRAAPIELRFARSAPADPSAYERAFPCPMRFGASEDAIVLSRDDLGLRVAMADPSLLAWLERFAASVLRRAGRGPSWSERTAEVVCKLLLSGAPPLLETAANELAASPRRLQRELKAEGGSFRSILDQARASLSRELLEEGVTELSEMAFLLGFSEQSAFNRAFKRWTGSTPLEYARGR
jgi:AraC-like DNA-binding protein